MSQEKIFAKAVQRARTRARVRLYWQVAFPFLIYFTIYAGISLGVSFDFPINLLCLIPGIAVLVALNTDYHIRLMKVEMYKKALKQVQQNGIINEPTVAKMTIEEYSSARISEAAAKVTFQVAIDSARRLADKIL